MTLFRVGVATESGPWTESDIRFAANCWATGVIVSNEEKFGNPYGPPELLALRPESERAVAGSLFVVHGSFINIKS